METTNTNEAVMQSIVRRAEQHIEDMTGVSVTLEIKIDCVEINIPIDKVANLLCREWSIRPKQLKARSRKRLVVSRKEVFTKIIRENYPTISFAKIAEYLGGYNHTTAINWDKSANNFIKMKDDYFMSLYEPIKKIVDADTI